MYRLKFVVVFLGGMLAFWGFQEYRVSSGASQEPLTIELSSIEAGEEPENTYLHIPKHSALYFSSVYEYEQSKYSTSEPTPASKVNHTYYPIISAEHPFNTLLAKYGDIESVPEGTEFPAPDSFAVLVKTKRFKKIGDIPVGIDPGEEVKGLLINRISSLGSEEEKLVRETFPNVNVDKLLILEDGREPSSALKSMGMMGGGVVLVLGGLASFFIGRK